MVVAEVGETADEDQIYRLTYDGSVADEHGFVAMGGQAEQISHGADRALPRRHALEEALPTGRRAARPRPGHRGVSDQLTASPARGGGARAARPRRKFRRLTGAALASCSARPSRRAGGRAAPDERETSPPDIAGRRLARAVRSGRRGATTTTQGSYPADEARAPDLTAYGQDCP